MNNGPMELTPDQMKDLGTIVTETKEDPEVKELEQKIQELQLSRINLRVSPAMFDSLNRVAELKDKTIEQHCEQILRDSLEVNVGKALISGPSTLSGHKTTSVKGPTYSVTRTNGNQQ